MNKPLISVIVPVYNVKDFVKKSLESIVNQSYRDIEIIVINDSSTDNSFEICKETAQNDSRFIFIEQKNQGLSAARNTGIKASKGEYLMFVDSDDWLAENIIDFLYSEILKYNIKLAMCGFRKVSLDEVTPIPEIQQTEIVKCDNAIERMLLGEWWSAWAKLFHRSIFNFVLFPHGRTIEDYAILVQILEQCEKVSYNPTELYFYLNRENSITTKPLNIRNFDEIYNSLKVLDYVEKKHTQFYLQAERNLGASLIKIILKVYYDTSGEFKDKISWLLTILKKHEKSLLKNPHLPKKQKVIVWVLCNVKENVKVFLLNIYKFYNFFFK